MVRLAATPTLAAEKLDSGKLQYNRDIRPILAEACFTCHGPDSAARKADLRLDRRDVAISMQAIVPGAAVESGIIERIESDDPDLVMPPPSTKKELTEAQKGLLKQWIAEGAEYQPHWSFIAPVRPSLPAVKQSSWVRNPLDAFVLAQLEANGLEPAPEANRRALARRLSLDLTGLPPKPELVEAFVNDASSDAYEKLVDQLLASPHWGEHRGRFWLDVARYADTHGLHFDSYREIWLYRDWVISAFNRNQSFDQFTIEQLAGDLIPNRSLEQQIATGFNRCNVTTSEGGIIPEEYLVLYTRDRTETVSQAWLGLTAGCAVCHDHKFDPLSQRGFYQMAAFFNNTTQEALDGTKSPRPTVRVYTTADNARLPQVKKELADIQVEIDKRRESGRGEFDAWLAQVNAEELLTLPSDDSLALHLPLNDGTGPALGGIARGESIFVDVESAEWDSGVSGNRAIKIVPATSLEVKQFEGFEYNQPFSMSVWIKLTEPHQMGAIVSKMADGKVNQGWDFWVQDNRIGLHLITDSPQAVMKVLAIAPVELNQWCHVLITHDGSGTTSGIRIYYDGMLQPAIPEGSAITSSIRADVPLKLAQRNTGQHLQNAVLQDLRLYDKELSPGDARGLALSLRLAGPVTRLATQRTEAELQGLYKWWLGNVDASFKQLIASQETLESEEREISQRATDAHVMDERPTAPMAFILNRGNYDNRLDEVSADTPDFLPGLPAEYPKNRLGFAKWLLLPDHPLTARVTVNRFWQELFGTGLVRTTGDFGVSGELPINQELLDWLAVEFREDGWDVKKLFKLMVTSATYRQSAITTPEKIEKDPFNRLCSRGPRFRMDAEMIRDYALATSGLLVEKIGGPSVKPYQPEGVWEAVTINISNTYTYEQDHGESLYRRSLYTFWKRTAPPPAMEVLNAPTRETCTLHRERTNTPLQALVTLNDPQLVEASRHLAENVLREASDDNARIDLMARRVLARPFRPNETEEIKASLHELREHYRHDTDAARKLISVGESKPDASLEPDNLAAWTMLANELLNLDEVLKK